LRYSRIRRCRIADLGPPRKLEKAASDAG
jgi:hypothetical protein